MVFHFNSSFRIRYVLHFRNFYFLLLLLFTIEVSLIVEGEAEKVFKNIYNGREWIDIRETFALVVISSYREYFASTAAEVSYHID